MMSSIASQPRVSVDGKFFRLGEEKFYVKGVAYGPFALNVHGEPFRDSEQTARDFAQIRELGANLVRIYHVPRRWFLDLAVEHHLKVLIDVPWNKHLCFLDSAEGRNAARDAVRSAVHACGRHTAVFGFNVANEIPPDVARWSGGQAVADFIDELMREARSVDPDCLYTFSNYPPTEFLRPQSADFVCFNVYLHDRLPFESYVARLQTIADTKPLLLGELGMDSLREGETRKCEFFSWQIQSAFRGGVGGTIVFSFTDEWFRGGALIKDWAMGLTTRDRQPKDSFKTVQRMFRAAPYFPLPCYPIVSIVVASFNGDRTLKACLESLQRQHYPDYEIILVDDGSTDTTCSIAPQYPNVRCFRHERNLGLGSARNTGIAEARGEIVAFTDADCRADEDWLRYLVDDLVRSEFVGLGGHNLLPPEDSPTAAAVMVSPGGPAHVMLTDRQAEHIPGCNMVFYKWALTEVGGFDPMFHRAGDDVDICWRLQQAGHKIGFTPAAFVWHYRRSTLGAYLNQQSGYGEAEALLVRKHPEYFNSFGGSIWRGRIYTSSKFGLLIRSPIIYRGPFGSGWFQTLYASEPAPMLMLCTSLEYHVLVTLPLWVLSVVIHSLLPLAITSLAISIGVCAAAGAQADLPKEKQFWWSRPLVAVLFLLQPIARGWARYRGRLSLKSRTQARDSLDSIALRDSRSPLNEVRYRSERQVDRVEFVGAILRRLEQQGWPHRSDIGWSEYDVELYGSLWSNLQLTTVTEEHSADKKLIRCRLHATWSLSAQLAFWSLLGLDLLVLGGPGHRLPLGWLVLLTVPLLGWFLRRQRRRLQSVAIVFLDELAKEWGLVKLPLHGGENQRRAAG